MRAGPTKVPAAPSSGVAGGPGLGSKLGLCHRVAEPQVPTCTVPSRDLVLPLPLASRCQDKAASLLHFHHSADPFIQSPRSTRQAKRAISAALGVRRALQSSRQEPGQHNLARLVTA